MTVISHEPGAEDQTPACTPGVPYDPRGHSAPACTPEVCTPTEGETLLQEALAEMTSTVRDEAKAVIQERIREIQHLEVLLAKAKADLQALTQRPAAEIAMGSVPRARNAFVPSRYS